MPACAAGGEDNSIDGAKLLRREIQAAELRAAVLIVQPAAHSVFQSLRLLKNLLEHVVRKAAQLDIRLIDRQIVHQMVDAAVLSVRDLERICRDEGNLVIGQIDDLVSPPGERRGVAGDECSP